MSLSKYEVIFNIKENLGCTPFLKDILVYLFAIPNQTIYQTIGNYQPIRSCFGTFPGVVGVGRNIVIVIMLPKSTLSLETIDLLC